MTDENKAISVNRWRLVLGGMSDKSLSFTGDKAEIITFQDMEKLLDYLYSRAQGDDVRNENSRQGGQGGSEAQLMNVSKNIITSSAHLSFLTALDENADPAYDKATGQKLADMGAFVGSLTPDKLGDYIGKIFA